MENKTPTTTIQQNESVVFDLKEFFMSNSSFQRFNREVTSELSSELDVVSKISKSKKTINVFIEIRLVAQNKEQKDVFNITSNYMGAFSYQDVKDEKQIEMFAKGNGPAILYPLIRASIASQSVAAEITPIRLPIINFFKFPVVIEFED